MFESSNEASRCAELNANNYDSLGIKFWKKHGNTAKRVNLVVHTFRQSNMTFSNTVKQIVKDRVKIKVKD